MKKITQKLKNKEKFNSKEQFRLKSLRLDKKLSITDMAEAVAIDVGTYRNIENGNRSLSISNAWRIAAFFNKTIDYVFCNKDK